MSGGQLRPEEVLIAALVTVGGFGVKSQGALDEVPCRAIGLAPFEGFGEGDSGRAGGNDSADAQGRQARVRECRHRGPPGRSGT